MMIKANIIASRTNISEYKKRGLSKDGINNGSVIYIYMTQQAKDLITCVDLDMGREMQ